MASLTYILYRLIGILRRILFRVNFTANNFIQRFYVWVIQIWVYYFYGNYFTGDYGYGKIGRKFSLLYRQISITRS